jgi:predicted DCC family thiol-disulfide oxidoreductase YuxK
MQKEHITELSYEHPIIFFDGVCHLCDCELSKSCSNGIKKKFSDLLPYNL